MAKHCDVSMPVEFSEENLLLALLFPFLKVKTSFGYLSVLLACQGTNAVVVTCLITCILC